MGELGDAFQQYCIDHNLKGTSKDWHEFITEDDIDVKLEILEEQRKIRNSIPSLFYEIDKIVNSDIQDFTENIVYNIPIDSWKMNSSRDHHMVDERGEWGNLIHTLRVVKICDTLADVLNLPQESKDVLKSAAILHDSCKHGLNAEYQFITYDHPYLVKQLIEKSNIECPYKPQIIDIISRHMGRWDKRNTLTKTVCDWIDGNNITLAFLLHSADCIEARLPSVIEVKKE